MHTHTESYTHAAFVYDCICVHSHVLHFLEFAYTYIRSAFSVSCIHRKPSSRAFELHLQSDAFMRFAAFAAVASFAHPLTHCMCADACTCIAMH